MQTGAPEDVMTKYLLGELSETEEQTLEEKFFDDGEFFAHLLAVENDLVDSYLQDELSGQDRVRFEKRFLASAEGRQKLENAEALRKHIAQRKLSAPADTLKGRPSTVWQSLLGFSGSQSPVLRYALATALIIMTAGAGWLLYDSSRLRNQLELARNEQSRSLQIEQDLQEARRREHELEQRLIEQRGQNDQLAEQLRQETERIERMEQEVAQLRQRQPSILTTVLTPGLTRGGGGPTNVVIPSGTEILRFRLPLPAERSDYKSYSATLHDIGGGQVLSQKNLKPEASRSRKALVVRLSPRLLQEKAYVFSVKGEARDGRTESVEAYQFNVVKK